MCCVQSREGSIVIDGGISSDRSKSRQGSARPTPTASTDKERCVAQEAKRHGDQAEETRWRISGRLVRLADNAAGLPNRCRLQQVCGVGFVPYGAARHMQLLEDFLVVAAVIGVLIGVGRLLARTNVL